MTATAAEVPSWMQEVATLVKTNCPVEDYLAVEIAMRRGMGSPPDSHPYLCFGDFVLNHGLKKKPFVSFQIHPDKPPQTLTRVEEITLSADSDLGDLLDRLRRYGAAEIVSPERVTVRLAWDPSSTRDMRDELDQIPHESVRSGSAYVPFNALRGLDSLTWCDEGGD